MMKKKWILIVMLALFSPHTYASRPILNKNHGFLGWNIIDHVQIGMQKSYVLSMLGAPSYVPLSVDNSIMYMSTRDSTVNPIIKIATISFNDRGEVISISTCSKKSNLFLTSKVANRQIIAKRSLIARIKDSFKASRPYVPSA